MTIMIEIAPELEQQLHYAAAQAGLAPDAYIVETLREHLTQPSNAAIQQHPTAQHLSLTEADLMLKINHSLTGITWSRYHSLVAKRRSETLTFDDQQELITLSDQIEAANVERLTSLTALARLRRVSLAALMQELGLQPDGDA